MTSLSPATMGEESPLGVDAFHFRFLSGPNSTGGFWPSATPDPSGPRNRGHTSCFSAHNPAVANAPINTSGIKFFMLSPRLSFVGMRFLMPQDGYGSEF